MLWREGVVHPEEEMDQCDTMGRKIGSRLDPPNPIQFD